MRALILIILALPYIGKAQEYARILESSTQYTIYDQESVDISYHEKTLINSEKGYKNAIFIDYFDDFRKIKSVSITIYDKNGKKVKKLNKEDGIEIGFNPSYEISDGKILRVDPEYQEYPFIIDFNVSVKLKGFISLPPWVPRNNYNLTVEQADFEIIRPNNYGVILWEENITDNMVVSETENSKKYEVKNLPYTDKKIRYKDFYNEQPKVLVAPKQFSLENIEGSNSNWKDFGNWFYKLNNEPFELKNKTKEYIDGLDKSDTLAFIANVYKYMQENTRYVSIQLGIGGFKSLPTEDVEEYGYGDCKALTTYAKNMLSYAGIKSNYILVRAGNDVPDIKPEFTTNQFNHVFLGIPLQSDTVFLECTSQISPANYVGTFTDDRHVLWIKNNESQVIRSKTYTPKENIKQNNLSIILDKEGNSEIKIEELNRGVFFDELMLFKYAPNDYIKKHNREKFSYKDFTLENFEYEQISKDSAIFNSSYKLRVNGIAKKAGTRLIVPVILGAQTEDYLDHSDLMKYFTIKRGATIIDKYTVSIPRNIWVNKLPEQSNLTSKYGSYHLSVSKDGEKLIIERKITLYKGDYYKDEYSQFKEFYEKIKKLENTKIVLNSKT